MNCWSLNYLILINFFFKKSINKTKSLKSCKRGEVEKMNGDQS